MCYIPVAVFSTHPASLLFSYKARFPLFRYIPHIVVIFPKISHTTAIFLPPPCSRYNSVSCYFPPDIAHYYYYPGISPQISRILVFPPQISRIPGIPPPQKSRILVIFPQVWRSWHFPPRYRLSLIFSPRYRVSRLFFLRYHVSLYFSP